MAIRVAVHSTIYGPWEDGADEPETLDTGDFEEDYSVKELVQWLQREGFWHPSCSGPITEWAWMTTHDADPYTGGSEVKSVHLVRGQSPAKAKAWRKVCAYIQARQR